MSKKAKKLDKNSQAYWERLLRKKGLSMDAGRDPGHRGKLVYVGDSNDVTAVEEIMVRKQAGRTVPKGASPEANL